MVFSARKAAFNSRTLISRLLSFSDHIPPILEPPLVAPHPDREASGVRTKFTGRRTMFRPL